MIMPKRYSYLNVKDFIEKNTDFKLLDTEYINCKNKLKLQCKCGNKHELNFDVIKNLGQSCCPECSANNKIENKRRKSFLKIKKFVEENSDSILLEKEYKNNRTKMKFKCKCGNEFITTYGHFKGQNKRECNDCGDLRRTGKFKPYTIEKVRDIIKSKECELLSNNYIKNNQKLDIKCKCGEKFVTDLATFKGKNKIRCDKCTKKQSSYSRLVEDFLIKNNIVFIKEYRFKNCRNILPLPFDFYLPKLKVCIEVDGELHYEPSRFKSSEENFAKTLFRDSIKSDFCKKNNIKLIRIPYYEIKNKTYTNRINMLIPR